MPEIPDLEAIRGFLEPRLRGNPLTSVTSGIPWLVRTGLADLETLVGHEFAALRRHGKFLLFTTDDSRRLVVNPMLTGRFHWAEPGERKRPMTALILAFADGHELRYSDARRMGRWYLVSADGLNAIPQWPELGPDALAVDEETFVARLKRHPGQIKSTLTNQKFIAGVGNAYSDEILWEAGLHPHRRRATMTEDDLRGLYRAMRATIEWAVPSCRPRSPTACTRATRSGGIISVSTGRWTRRVPVAAPRSGARSAAGARPITVSTASRSCSDDLRQHEAQRHYSMGRASSYCSMEGEP